MLRISVKNFGPINEGSVELGPMTIFIGPNNAGKSYLSLLIYAVFRALHSCLHDFAWRSDMFEALHDSDSILSGITRSEFSDLLVSIKSEGELIYSKLPDSLQEILERQLLERFHQLPSILETELKRSFGSNIADITKRYARGPMQINVYHPNNYIEIQLQGRKNELVLNHIATNFADIPIAAGRAAHLAFLGEHTLRSMDASERASLSENVRLFMFEFMSEVFEQTFGALFGQLKNIPYYFPAARSGILQSHKALASVLVSKSSLVGLQPIQVPRLSGVVTDFITRLLQLERHSSSGPMKIAAQFIESEIANGSIDIEGGKSSLEYPEVSYSAQNRKYSINQTSSMVSELAPVVLFLKYVIQAGDIVMIEEPEAHLHPDHQRLFAKALARIVRGGTSVLITTHSDYFVQQLSNFISLSSISTDRRKELGYAANDFLRSQEVYAYLFERGGQRSGTRIRKLQVSEQDGIPEDEFLNIAESLYNETAAIQRELELRGRDA